MYKYEIIIVHPFILASVPNFKGARNRTKSLQWASRGSLHFGSPSHFGVRSIEYRDLGTVPHNMTRRVEKRHECHSRRDLLVVQVLVAILVQAARQPWMQE